VPPSSLTGGRTVSSTFLEAVVKESIAIVESRVSERGGRAGVG
jgi:hypothetical protein